MITVSCFAVSLESSAILLPLGDPGVPRAEIGRRRLHDRVELAEGGLHVGHDRHMHELVLVDLGRIDIDVHDEAMLGEGLHLACHAIVEPHPHRDQEVGLIDGVVGVDAPVHAEHVERERVVAGEHPQTHERHRDRDARLLDKRANLVCSVGGDHAAAGVDHGPLGPLDGGCNLRDLLRMGRSPRLGMVAGQVHCAVVVGHDLCKLNILWQIDEHRARPARGGDVKRLLHHPGEVFGIGDKVVMLGDPAADLHHRRFLKRVGANHARADLTGEHDEWDAVEFGISNRRDEVQGARTARAHANARPAGGAGVTLGGERPSLLVPRQDRANLVLVAGECLVERHACPTRIRKDHVDAVPDERLNDHVGPRHEGFGCFRRAGGSGHGVTPESFCGGTDRQTVPQPYTMKTWRKTN